MAKLQWTARYNDGTSLNQIDSDGTTHAYLDIDRTKLETFILHEGEGTIIKNAVIFDGDGEKLVWTRRTRMTLGEEPQVFHIVGKKDEFILAISEDYGTTVARHNFVDDGLFYEVVQ